MGGGKACAQHQLGLSVSRIGGNKARGSIMLRIQLHPVNYQHLVSLISYIGEMANFTLSKLKKISLFKVGPDCLHTSDFTQI